jgi:DNA invertase Pin-like site-specific DNA recombinase
MQLRDLREYCHRREWHIVEEYIDQGFSGDKRSRPAFDSLMIDAHKRKVDVILVWKLDRWGRNMMHCFESIQDLAAHGVRWIAVTQGLDTSTNNPMARAMLGLMAVFAEFEREMICERVRAGVRNARARGIKLGRRKLIFRRDIARNLHASGKTWREVAKEMCISEPTLYRVLKKKPA